MRTLAFGVAKFKVSKHFLQNALVFSFLMNELSICLTSTTFLNKELKHKNNKLKLSTKSNKADNAVLTIGH
ncbi:hypothetical protein D4Z78_20160 [Okeania hirsuta]|nr:hypothetical protein D4Z78_20160 [Okeania hirsuta]